MKPLEIVFLVIVVYLFLVVFISFTIRSFGDYIWYRYRLFVKDDKRGFLRVMLEIFMSPGTFLVKKFKPVYYHYKFNGERKVKYILKPPAS